MLIHKSIKYYFILQLKRFSRRAAEYELPAGILAGIALLVFFSVSAFLFYKTSMASWIYIFFAVAVMYYLKDKHTNYIFTLKQSLVLNILANNLIAIPFLAFLIYKTEWISASILVIIPTLIALLPSRSSFNLKTPTPFRKWPFEFVVGFRQSILLIFLAYFLVFKGIQVGNENLGFASLGFLFLLSMSFYFRPEDEYFVWINDKNPRQFLIMKIRYALISSSILSAIPALCLLIFIPSQWYIVPIIFSLGFLYLTTIIVAKYSTFPHEISIPQAIILIISFLLPLILIITIPAFYKKAIRKLNPILEC